MKGIFPMLAMPAATAAMFCSATPTWMNLLGYFFLKSCVRVLSLRSAQRTTTAGFFSPSWSSASPYPSLVGVCCGFFRFARLCCMSFTFEDAFSDGFEFFDCDFCLFWCGWFAVPEVVVFHEADVFAGDGVGYYGDGFFVDCC